MKNQQLNDGTIKAEAKYSINFTKSKNKFCLSLYYNGSNTFYVSCVKIDQFKAKNSEIKSYPLCLCNISKDFMVNNVKNWIKGICLSFYIDYNAIAVSDIVNIHNI